MQPGDIALVTRGRVSTVAGDIDLWNSYNDHRNLVGYLNTRDKHTVTVVARLGSLHPQCLVMAHRNGMLGWIYEEFLSEVV